MGAGLERQLAAGLRQDANVRIRIPGVPAGNGDVVVELIVGVPSQHDVAEPESLLEPGEELLARQVLPSQDAVEIEDADLDVRCAARFDELASLSGRFYFAGLHVVSSAARRPAAAPACRNVTSLPTVTKLWPRAKSCGAVNPGNVVEPAHLPQPAQAPATWSTAPARRRVVEIAQTPEASREIEGPEEEHVYPVDPGDVRCGMQSPLALDHGDDQQLARVRLQIFRLIFFPSPRRARRCSARRACRSEDSGTRQRLRVPPRRSRPRGRRFLPRPSPVRV